MPVPEIAHKLNLCIIMKNLIRCDGVYPVPTQCPTPTGFSSQVVGSPRTPAIPINSLLFGESLDPAELGWEIAFAIQVPLIGSVKEYLPQGGGAEKKISNGFKKAATKPTKDKTQDYDCHCCSTSLR